MTVLLVKAYEIDSNFDFATETFHNFMVSVCPTQVYPLNLNQFTLLYRLVTVSDF